MKCKIFWGCPKEAIDAFNKWAKGKQLNREVIIHEHILPNPDSLEDDTMIIVVYHPEGKEWDATSEIIYTKAREEEQKLEAGCPLGLAQ